jgi:transposase
MRKRSSTVTAADRAELAVLLESLGKNFLALDSSRKGTVAYNKAAESLVASIAKCLGIVGALNTVKDSRNGHVPPGKDQTKPRKTRAKGKGRPGGVKGHPGSTHKWNPIPDEVAVLRLEDEEKLEADPDWEKREPVVHQVEDFVILKKITNFEASSYVHVPTGKVRTAEFPDYAKAPFQFGPNVKSFVVLARGPCSLPVNKVVLITEAMGCKVCPSTVTNMHARAMASQGMADYKEGVKLHIINADVANADETQTNVDGKKKWVHFAGTEKASHFHASSKRGREGIEEGGVIQFFRGTLVTDCWAAYFCFLFIRAHAICGAHLVRELEDAFETGHKWAEWMSKLLLGLNKLAVANGGKIPDDQVRRAKMRYRTIISRGYTETGGRELPRPPGKRGRLKKTQARNLLERMDKFQEYILAFAFDEKIPFTNNLAERALRPLKVHDKVSGTFKSMMKAQEYVDLLGYVDTCRKNGMGAIDSIRTLIAGKTPDFIIEWLKLPPPLPLPPAPTSQNVG